MLLMTKAMVAVEGGRFVRVQTFGPSTGKPIFLMHGTPGSRLGPRPTSAVLSRLGVRLISYDRPGFGDSDRFPGRRVSHAAADTAAIADFLGFDSFSVVGRSGGGPHALACAALLPARVSSVAALVSLAPRDAAGLDWYAGMGGSNAQEFRAAESGLESLRSYLKPIAETVNLVEDEDALPFDEEHLHESDRRIVGEPEIRRTVKQGFIEALKHSEAGWVDDDVSFCQPWGFDVSAISVPTLLWHGAHDVFSPLAHSRWLAQSIPNAALDIDSTRAHMGALVVMPDVLSWLLSPTSGRVSPTDSRLEWR